MKLVVLSLTVLMSFTNTLFATEKSQEFTEVECHFLIDSEKGSDFEMTGVLRLPKDAPTAYSYLTLEPPIVASIPITARILLTRFDGEEYFPMTLHPRGDTAFYLAHTRLDGKTQNSLSYKDGGLSYYLVCMVL